MERLIQRNAEIDADLAEGLKLAAAPERMAVISMSASLMKRLVVLLFLSALPLSAARKVHRIMPIGDSITEGGSSFSNWRYPLWEKLFTAGYLVEYVGTRTSPSRIGDLRHEGYGGKDSAFLAKTVPPHFRENPADIVLIHAGHNHFADRKPVPGILKDTEDLIRSLREVKDDVVVLLALPIPSAKLPKYGYLPELQRELPELAARISRPQSPVVIVPQCEGYDPVKDNVADLVHPNASGARKMADRWFEALVKVMEKPGVSYHPRLVPYRKTAAGELHLHVFTPPASFSGPRPAIVFFFGGGWQRGTPLQFYPECDWFASKGFVAISADYRTAFTHRATPFDAVADAKSALRSLRGHAQALRIDPSKIIAAGASAGGHLAAATGILEGLDDPTEPSSLSARPDAMILWYPVLDNGPGGYGDAAVKARFQEFSPLHQVRSGVPAALVFIGDKDPLVPVDTIRTFQSKMKNSGVPCEVEIFEGAGHPVYPYQKGDSPLRDRALQHCERFLKGLGMFPS